VADDEVEKVAGALAAELAAGPTRSLGRAKRVIYAGATSALEEAMGRESLNIADAADTADAREGIAAFLARRPAEFTGR
jgi:enoyl-CoA hydratase/carnithine racemase